MADIDFEQLALREVLASSRQIIGVVDPGMTVRWVSKSAERYNLDVVGRALAEIIHPVDYPRAAQAFDGAAQRDGFTPSLMAQAVMPIRFTTSTGIVPFDTSGRWVEDDRGQTWLVATLQDMSTRFATDQAVHKLAAGADEIESMQAIIAVCREYGGVQGAQIIWQSGRTVRTFGDLGTNPADVIFRWGDLSDLVNPGRVVDTHGSEWSFALPVFAGTERLGAVVMWGTGTAADLSLVSAVMEPLLDLAALSLKRSRELVDLERRATTDQVTGLMNRYAFFSELDRLVQDAAVMYIDLDGFKAVNDRFGHTLGDRLLNIIGRRLADAVQSEDYVARIGGDEFAVLSRSVSSADARSTGNRILGALNQTFVIDGHRIKTGASVGIAYTETSIVGRDLLDSADQALLEAKAQGKGRAVVVASF